MRESWQQELLIDLYDKNAMIENVFLHKLRKMVG